MLSGSEVVLSVFIGSRLPAMSLFSRLRNYPTVLAFGTPVINQKVCPDVR